MSEEIVISVSRHETRVAVVAQTLLQEIFIERSHTRGTLGNIYKGKVVRILPGMQSAFIDIGQPRAAFVHITDLMYALKRDAIKHRLYPKRFPIPVLAREFYNLVRRHGRNSEVWLVVRMALKSNPFVLLSMAKYGLGLMRTGRMSLRQERIKGTHELQAGLAGPQEVSR